MPLTCKSTAFNPITETNWDNMYPMKLLSGFTYNPSSNKDPSDMAMPPVCNCGDGVGVGMTFWEPAHIIEVVIDPGYSPTMGTTVIDGYEQLAGVAADLHTVRHVHWYIYPLFKMLNLFSDTFSCLSRFSDMAVGYMSELDPIWLDPEYSLISNPATVLFASHVAHMSCAADVVASNLYKPINSLFWCAGSHGNIYPQTGAVFTKKGNANIGLAYAHKTLYKLTKLGAIGRTIGSDAQCQSRYDFTLHSNFYWQEAMPLKKMSRMRRKSLQTPIPKKKKTL